MAHGHLAPGAISGWLVPSEFMDVNYGRAVKRYLLERVSLLRIHRFDPNDVQFADALVSSAIVWFRNDPPQHGARAVFTFGGSLAEPRVTRAVSLSALAQEAKWSRFPLAAVRPKTATPTLAEFFRVRRGVATGDNSYFILSEGEIAARRLPRNVFRSILPGPRHIDGDEVDALADGTPRIGRRLFLLDPQLPEAEIAETYPALWTYLREGRAKGLPERYLCAHRALWYTQERRPPAPIVCTYLGRSDSRSGRPFRFILNRSDATVANVYLALYPTPLLDGALRRDPALIRRIWAALNRIAPERLLGEGRVYGGGLHKLEPSELANLPVPEIAAMLPGPLRPRHQADVFGMREAV
jgi:adenine-specific DNA-methyltransferase